VSTADQEWRLESIFHFVVNATNFERSLAFYTMLGFRVLRDNRDVVWPSTVARNFGMPAAQGRGALLGIGDGPEHTRLDLIEWLEPTVDPHPDVAPEHAVPRVMALRTHNVQGAYDDLSARGVEFVSTPASARRAGIVNVCTCRDPDGLLVELIEYEPGQLGSRIDHLRRRDDT
jgi:catechol 2,3-dioxygenase-like lactoylglutathione lyase family enzyme